MSTPRVRDLRLVPLAGIVWVTALGCVFFPLVSWWCVLAGVVGAAVALGVLLRDRARRRLRGGGLLVLLALAAAAAAMTAALAVPQREAAAEWDGHSVEVVGEIASSASTGSDGRIWF
ncbi:DUF4131 domain-containing protein, partial [Microbacterium sp.]|uniref:DUF4131 domain-containing protein n=1 Tax=Microbacterium sp. TaxID=51671 RepID=UPI0026040FC4